MLRRSAIASLSYVLLAAAAPVGHAQDTPPGDGYALLRAGKPAEAIAVFRQAITKNAKDIGAYVGLGQALHATGSLREAVHAHSRAVQLSPYSASIRLGLGTVLLEADRLDQAEVELSRAAQFAPGDAGPLLLLGDLHMKRRQPERALRSYTLARGLAVANPMTHYSMGRAYQELRMAGEALEQYRAAVRAQPGFRPGLLALLALLNEEKRYADALAEADARQGATEDLEVRAARAIALDGLKRRDEAIAEYQSILKIDPSQATVWGNLGWTQYGAGRYDDAIASSRKALELNAGLAYVRYNLGLLLAVKGDWAAARAEYETALAAGSPEDLVSATEDVRAAAANLPTSNSLKEALAFLQARAKQTGRAR